MQYVCIYSDISASVLYLYLDFHRPNLVYGSLLSHSVATVSLLSSFYMSADHLQLPIIRIYMYAWFMNVNTKGLMHTLVCIIPLDSLTSAHLLLIEP